MEKELEKIIEKLSPLERKIVPFLNLPLKEIREKSNLDQTSLLRALKFLENKKIIQTKAEEKKIVDLDTNGILYKNKGLPERRLIEALEKNNHISLDEAKAASSLSDNEFKVSLGVLKSKALIDLKNGKLNLTASKSEISKKSFEEQLLEILPIEESKIEDAQALALSNLKKRKEIIIIKQKTIVKFELTEIGKKIAGKKINLDLIEEVTPEIIKNANRKNKFRAYDIQAPVPAISAGKKHFVNQSIDYARRIWLDLGFKEMTGNKVQSSFWNFDALFTAQDHPVREMQDTFFLKDKEAKIENKNILNEVKNTHEKGISGSKGWQYDWSKEESQRVVLRTHTTGLSAQTLSTLDIKKDLPAKFFAIGKNFRNETVDWSHLFEFYQTEGIVVDESVTFKHLLGYLEEFYKKMGFKEIRFAPAYFPYTEPSVEIHVYHPEKKVWLELGGAGIFRPEITAPLLGKPIPVLAWGQGFERIILDYYKISDLREMYKNDLSQLRKIKSWIK